MYFDKGTFGYKFVNNILFLARRLLAVKLWEASEKMFLFNLHVFKKKNAFP
jgi:hypothetical protein